MRITNTMVTSGLLTEIQQLDSSQSLLQGEVASGLAVTQPSDNPAAFGGVMQLESQNRALAQYGNNAARALNLASASYSGLNTMMTIYDRVVQLGALGTGTNGAQSQQAYATELNQLIQQTVQVANSQLGGQYLYGGTAVNAPPFTAATNGQGDVTAVTYVGDPAGAPIPLSTTSTVTPSTSGATNQGMADFINHLVALRDSLNANNITQISAANAALVPDESVISSAVAENGAVQARILSEQTQQQSQLTELSSQISGATNADLAKTEVKLNRAQLAYQAALQTAASVMHLSILNYVNLG